LVLQTIIGGYEYPGGWLETALRGTDPDTGQSRDLVYAVHFVNQAWLLPGYLAAIAGCQPDKVNQVVQIILAKLDQARQGQFTPDEFTTAKDLIIAADALDKQTNADLASQACLDELYGLGYDFHQDHARRIDVVTVDQVQRVARQYLTQPIVCISTPRPDLLHLPFETQPWPTTQPQTPSSAGSDLQ
jgi:predicted Zn-dependent peptidase